MAILKAFLATFLMEVILTVLSLWIIPVYELGFEHVIFFYKLANCILCALAVFIFIWLIRKPGEKIIEKTNYSWYLLAIVLGGAYPFIQYPLNLMYDGIFSTDYTIHPYFHGFDSLRINTVICTVLLAPITEELFFRSYIQKSLLKNLHFSLVIGISAFLFALIHLDIENLFFDGMSLNTHHMYITFFGGLISATLYYKSKSLGPSLLMHMSWNLISIIF